MKFFGETSATDWQRPSVIALLLANLVPVAGVFIFHWEVFPLMFLFWSENVIIGVFNVLKMLCAAPKNPTEWAGKSFNIPFFCVHYGMFTFIHGVIIIKIFGGGSGFPNVGTFLRIARENHLEWAILGFVISHGISFATNFLYSGEYKRTGASGLFLQPYARVIVLHVTIIFGGILMMFLNSPKAGLFLLVALKTVIDLLGHFNERTKFAERAEVRTD
ncbi:MAG: DUF6498-containing protein [Verrucomicrobiota bacterium]